MENCSNKKLQKKKNKKRKNPFRFWFYDFVKITAAIPTLLFFRNKNIYESKLAKKHIRKGAIVCANHTGFTDPIVIMCSLWYRRTHFVAMKELFATKRANWFFTHVNCLPIDRDNVNISSFKDIIATLKDNRVVGIFPEGHINENKEGVDFFKSGVILMALQANVPIVPMYIVKREKWYKRQVVVIGEPIRLGEEKFSLSQINEFSQALRDKEVKLMEIYNQRRKKK